MISRTKFDLDNATIEKLFAAAGFRHITDIAPLGAGEYNAVYSANADGREYAVKIAPKPEAAVLTYEKNMMASELYWYKQIKENTSIRVPEIIYENTDKKIIPAEFFIMEKLDGTQMDKTEFTDGEKVESAREMARMAGEIHKIKNDKFGYIQNGLYDDWYQAFRAMISACIDDCKAAGRKTRRGEKLLKFADKYRNILEKVECTMVNFDIWWPNIICNRENGVMNYAWIDPERSFWGDRIADFVCLEFFKRFDDKKSVSRHTIRLPTRP